MILIISILKATSKSSSGAYPIKIKMPAEKRQFLSPLSTNKLHLTFDKK